MVRLEGHSLSESGFFVNDSKLAMARPRIVDVDGFHRVSCLEMISLEYPTDATEIPENGANRLSHCAATARRFSMRAPGRPGQKGRNTGRRTNCTNFSSDYSLSINLWEQHLFAHILFWFSSGLCQVIF